MSTTILTSGLVYASVVIWYKVSHLPVLLVISRDPRRQRKGRLFLYDRPETYACRGHWRFCRPLEYRGYVQEYQAVAWQRGAADLERPRAGACGGDKFLAVLGGLGVVYPVWLSEKQHPDHAVVRCQDPSEFSGCVGHIEKGAVAETNYCNVRQSYRTCTNYRVLYQSRSCGCIINYQKCESSHK